MINDKDLELLKRIEAGDEDVSIIDIARLHSQNLVYFSALNVSLTSIGQAELNQFKETYYEGEGLTTSPLLLNSEDAEKYETMLRKKFPKIKITKVTREVI